MPSDKNEFWRSDEKLRHLVDSRKYLFRDDYISYVENWLKLRPNSSILDYGCGIGFLGQIFWPYIRDQGTYTGIDISHKVIAEASRFRGFWGDETRISFFKAMFVI